MIERKSMIVVDDHAIFRMGVAQTLASSDHFALVAEGSSASDAVELVGRHRPDLALLDVSMPGGGIAAATEICTRWPESRVVMLTVSEEDHDVLRALEAGVSGYVLKGTPAPQLLSILESVASGETYVSPTLGVRLLGAMRANGEETRIKQLLDSLSPKERLTLRFITDGLNNREIAEAMGIQVKTIKFHVSNVLHKLGLRNRVEAALFGQKYYKMDF